MAHRDPEAALFELSKLLPPASPSPSGRATPILKKASTGAFGSYVDIKRPSKAVLEGSPPSLSVLPPGTPQVLIVKQLEALTSVVALQSLLLRDTFRKHQKCAERHFEIEIGKIPSKVSTTILWTFCLKILFLIAIVLLLIFHPFLYRHWRW